MAKKKRLWQLKIDSRVADSELLEPGETNSKTVQTMGLTLEKNRLKEILRQLRYFKQFSNFLAEILDFLSRDDRSDFSSGKLVLHWSTKQFISLKCFVLGPPFFRARGLSASATFSFFLSEMGEPGYHTYQLKFTYG